MVEAEFPHGYLQINDLYRWDSRFERETEFQPEVHAGKTRIQSRESVESELLEAVTEAGEPIKLLRAKVNLGIRIVFLESPEGTPTTLHLVEATFAVEYLVIREPSEEQLAQFCKWNCIHNVWPFWRQYVFDTLKSASLPVVAVPFFHQMGRAKSQRKKVTRSRKSLPKAQH
ncbi:Preprotein translocase subunit SecB [Luteibacter sp. UNC138MFCol5.1]|uniref:protein-export chaperone SecB n=1 Tax=Luteibacter sp. UNC138MFCol5.1 TaxID=1502774 RepID=UPI0008C898B6|nr:protein-export chaperone SecB [Luteibacter sp. UNC138MFCol5.1]SEO74392.1 Preprotein translocase subunit SecB [Luteibacter sp. UNC138MFCol5.1]